MEKEFVSYEIALDLEGIGFEEKCISVFLTSTKKPYPMYRPYTKKEETDELLRPTFSQAFRWFREEYDLTVSIKRNRKFKSVKRYEVIIDESTYKEINMYGLRDYSTYEEAELKCLKKLIEIVQKK